MRRFSLTLAGLFLSVMSLVGMAVTGDALFFNDPADSVTGTYAVNGPGQLVVHADDSAVFIPWECDTTPDYSACAPAVSPDGAAINAPIGEDGSAHYADDSVYDPESGEFMADDDPRITGIYLFTA